MHDQADNSGSAGGPSGPAGLSSKVLASLSYLILLATTLYYSLAEERVPGDRLWQQQSTTLFAQSSLVTSAYWILLLTSQLLYICSLWSTTASYATAAARVSRCFIASSLLTSAFVHLWARSHFWLAELLLLASFFELSLTYFRHPDTPLSVHVGAVAGLLAWSFAALYWAGAAAARSTHLAARIVAHLSICGWLGYGMFYLSTYKDYVMGFALSVLSVSTGVGQLPTRLGELPLQPILAFMVAGLLFAASLAVSLPCRVGHEPLSHGRIASKGRERAPLLA